MSALLARLIAEPVADILSRSPERLPEIATVLGMDALTAGQVAAADCDFARLPLATARKRRMLPMIHAGRRYIVLDDPQDGAARHAAQALCAQQDAMLAITLPAAFEQRLARAEDQERAIDQIEPLAQQTETEAPAEISLASIAQEKSDVIRLFSSTLFDALGARASDIHLETTAAALTVKYRIDGVLHQAAQLPGAELAGKLISRLKVLAGMDIGERRVPQDGRFKARLYGRDVDFRASIMPSIHGEDAVLRVLDKNSAQQSITLASLGFEADTLRRIDRLTARPYGMVLVTGPTGSGKSTTLYAVLSQLNSGREKLITIEDPVEYQLDGVLQIPVNDKKGLTFAKGLRSILRHDPDIILVGEIRDAETAGIAVQAALTGHLVLSSVHANGVFSVIERFLYMNVEPASLLEALNGVVAQRLVRRICDQCAMTVAAQAAAPRQGAGCAACRHTGFHGRLALAEILSFSDALKDALLRRLPMPQVRAIAHEEGFVPLKQIAAEAVLAGKTTLPEVRRVIAMD